jgi:5-oxoprolinase (ATP-hydrolysing)
VSNPPHPAPPYTLVRHWGPDLRDGDVLVSNHPQLAGGSHLPDITVITPIFSGGEIAFFVASRGHHADVGGIAPGSVAERAR